MIGSASGAQLRQAYEDLRAHALGHPVASIVPRGFALFLQSGLPGWMQCWNRLVPSPSRPPTVASSLTTTSVGAGMGAELVLLLAQMALAGRVAPQVAGVGA